MSVQKLQLALHAKVEAKSLVREPDAGNLPVRFDERDVETEPWWKHWAPPDERGGNRYVLPNATAPHLDSTPNGPSLFRRPIFAVERRTALTRIWFLACTRFRRHRVRCF